MFYCLSVEIDLSQGRKEPNMKMVALAGVANSFYRTNMIEALDGRKEGLSYSDLYSQSMASSEGTFNYHLRELQRLAS